MSSSTRNTEESIYDTLIIGAGLSGALAAHLLSTKSKTVLIIDKGRGVGGRFSSKRFAHDETEISFNHGIENFSISQENERILQTVWFKNWINKNYVSFDSENNEWQIDVKSSELIKAILNNSPENRSHAEATSELVNLKLSFEAEQISYDSASSIVTVKGTNGQSVKSRHLIVTAPAPQSLKLMNAFLSETEKILLQKITYTKKLIIFGRNHLNETQMLKFSDEISEKFFELTETKILHHLNQIEPHLQQLQNLELKKWRYAKVKDSVQLSQDDIYLSRDFWTIYSDGFGPQKFSSFERAARSFL